MQQEIENPEIWVAFGKGRHFRFISIHSNATSLGPAKSKSLPMFHAITGCDTVSGFRGKGKNSAWDAWNVCPSLMDSLLALSNVSESIPEDVLVEIERFIVVLYSKHCPFSTVNEARRYVFSSSSSNNMFS